MQTALGVAHVIYRVDCVAHRVDSRSHTTIFSFSRSAPRCPGLAGLKVSFMVANRVPQAVNMIEASSPNKA
jgi:hypothetical protein